MSDLSSQFTSKQYVHLAGFLDRSYCDKLTAEMFELVEQNKTTRDPQCPLSEAIYGSEVYDKVLAELLPRFEQISGKRLIPTYSYARLYRPGEELLIHRDREACEISATLTLGFEGEPWPIWMGGEGKTNASAIVMDAGDAVLYRGMDKHHWREKFAGKWQAQLFLHYVDADGEYSKLKFDERGGLGQKKQIATNSTFQQMPPVVRFENFLGEETVNEMLEYVCSHENDFELSGVYRAGADEEAIDLSTRNSKKLEDLGRFDALIESAVSNVFGAVMAQLKLQNFEDPVFEKEFIWSGDGALFKRHIDTIQYRNLPSSSRILTMVYYFHKKPKLFSGGQLRLYPLGVNPKGETYVDVEPESDTVVFFPSWFPHEVMPVHSESKEFADGRFSINCWYHKSLKPKI